MPFTKNNYDAAMRDVFYLRNEINNLITQLRNQIADGSNFLKLGEKQALLYNDTKNTVNSDGTTVTANVACNIPARSTFYFHMNVTWTLYTPSVDGLGVKADSRVSVTNPPDTIEGAYYGYAVSPTPKYVSGDTPSTITVTIPIDGFYVNSSSSAMSSIKVANKLVKYVGNSITSNVFATVAVNGWGAVVL